MITEVFSEVKWSVTDLYETYREGLLRYATSLTRDSARADDLVQETFIRAMAHMALLDGLDPHQQHAWLCQVLKNLFLDQLRAIHRRQAMFERLAQQVLIDGPTFEALPYELFNLVPYRYRDLLRKRYILGMTSDEIGAEIGIPAATVRSRLRLAVEWLRTHQSEFM